MKGTTRSRSNRTDAGVCEGNGFSEVLWNRADKTPDRVAFGFFETKLGMERFLTFSGLRNRALAIADYLVQRNEPGSRVILLFPPGLAFIEAFFGCLHAGMVAVPLYPPRPREGFARIVKLIQFCGATRGLTTATGSLDLARSSDEDLGREQFTLTEVESIPQNMGPGFRPAGISHNQPALLQFTSGSTSEPKGVVVSHRSLWANQKVIGRAFGTRAGDIGLNWLPMYHDMGLIGTVLHAVHAGIPSFLMPPLAFVKGPFFWLEAIARHRATICGGPNFAFDLCVARMNAERAASLDLRSWRLAFNGAEPVRADTIARFSKALEPAGFRKEAFYPCYGMAEATLFIAGGSTDRAPTIRSFHKARLGQGTAQQRSGQEGVRLVGCGSCFEYHRLKIVDPETRLEKPEGQVGEVWFSGPSVADGYWQSPGSLREVFRARLSSLEKASYLRTGDLGFVDGGELFITGRAKDLIIIRGRNHHPHDLEASVGKALAAFKPGSCAAFSIEEGEERLVFLQEISPGMAKSSHEEIFECIHHTLAERHEIRAHRILLVKPRSIPRTSSGKIRRFACREAYLENTLRILARTPLRQGVSVGDHPALSHSALARCSSRERSAKVADYLQTLIAAELKLEPGTVPNQKALIKLGIDSISELQIRHKLAEDLGLDLPDSFNLGESSLTDLAERFRPRVSEKVQATDAMPAELPHRMPLSENQEALWFLYQYGEATPALHIAIAADLYGDLDVLAMEKALQNIRSRHPALRTGFGQEDGRVLQEVLPEQGYEPTVLDGIADRKRLGQVLSQLEALPFRLERGSPIRVCLLRAGPGHHLLSLTVHHLVSDLWSLELVMREFQALYRRFAGQSKVKPRLVPPSREGYGHFVKRQQAMLEGKTGGRLWEYWQKKMAGPLPELDLPTDRVRPQRPSYRGHSIPFHLDDSELRQWKDLAQSASTTLFTVLLAAFQTFMFRYSGQDEVVVGAPFSGRRDRRWKDLVGYFVNMLPLRANFQGYASFREFLGRTRTAVNEAGDHQDFPLQRLVQGCQPGRRPNVHPLFQAVFVLQRPGQDPELSAFAMGREGGTSAWPGLRVVSRALPKRYTQFDLALTMAEIHGGLTATLQCNRDLFSETGAGRMAAHLQNLLTAVVADPDRRLERIEILTPRERTTLLKDWSAKSAGPLPGQTLAQRFLHEATARRDAVALVGEGPPPGTIRSSAMGLPRFSTYGCLNGLSGRGAFRLRRLGLGPEAVAAVCMERSPEYVLAILSVLKAGGGYLPLDPDYPAVRLAYLLRDSSARLVVTGTSTELPASSRVLAVDIEELAAVGKGGPWEPAPAIAAPPGTPAGLAYVIYTSGSTGKPKGVMVSHVNVTRLLSATDEWFGFGAWDVWTLFHSFAFDFSVWELWGALLRRGRLVIPSAENARNPDRLRDILCVQRVTVLNQTPSAFRSLSDAVMRVPERVAHLRLRVIVFGGEALDSRILAEWLEMPEPPRFVNMYGITETCVHATYRVVSRNPGTSIAESEIGEPIPDLEILLLDRCQEPVPIGVPGEFHVAGPGVARGYLRRPARTAARFLPNPYSRSPGSRLYRSGDRGRYFPETGFLYAGRTDRQVKIRGFRIELGEIEARLRTHPALKDAVVVEANPAVRDRDRQRPSPTRRNGLTSVRNFLGQAEGSRERPALKTLAAYVIPESEMPSVTELREFTGTSLPSFMVPAVFIAVPRIPLTPNGKLDRNALPEPPSARPGLGSSYVPPATEAERILVDIWSRVLGLDEVGVLDDFFDLGGDSIRSIRVRALAEERGLRFSLQQMFRLKTIRGLANVVAKNSAETESLPETQPYSLVSAKDRRKLPQEAEDAYPLACIQAGVIFHSQQRPELPMYHDIFFYRLRMTWSEASFRKSLEALFENHPILRTGFDLVSYSRPLQLVYRTVEPPFEIRDLRQGGVGDREAFFQSWMAGEKKRPFDFSKPPLIRFFVFLLDHATFQIAISFHDAILDGWSTASMLTELLTRYKSALNPEARVEIPRLRAGFRQFIAMEREAIADPDCRPFWSKSLEGCSLLKLPRWPGYPKPVRRGAIGVVKAPIDEALSRELKRFAQEHGVPLKSALLAAHMVALGILGASGDVVTGLEANGRPEVADGERVLGIHLNSLPFRMRLPGGTWRSLAAGTFAAESALLPFRRFPLAELQKGRTPLFEVVFNYTHFHVFDRLKELEIGDAGGFGQTHFALRIEFNQDPFLKTVSLDLEGNLDELAPGQLRMIAGLYRRLLQAMVLQPEGRYERLSPLSPAERQSILVEWNHQPEVGEHHATVVAWFRARVHGHPDRVAMVFEERRYAYGALFREAETIARCLSARGLTPGQRVALLARNEPRTVAAIWGILMAGGSYVPMDGSAPKTRLAFMIRDAASAMLALSGNDEEALPQSEVEIWRLNRDSLALGLAETEDGRSSRIRAVPEGEAYVVYTSGSTGAPKGVAVSHQNLLTATLARKTSYPRAPGAFLLVSPLFFDSSMVGLFWTLTAGGLLALPGEGRHRDLWVLWSLMGRHRVTHWLSVPALYEALLAHGPNIGLPRLNTVVVAGESPAPGLGLRHRQRFPEASLYNEYGPTEATIWSTAHGFRHDRDQGVLPIGRPIQGAQAFVLDAFLRPVPATVIGEIYLAGKGISLGYVGRRAATAAAFLPNPFGERPGGRLYRTGDLGCWRLNGLLVHQGRVDRQIKLNGVRLEPGEIEACIATHPDVSENAVILRKSGDAGPRLIAYVVLREGRAIGSGSMRRFLATKLPRSVIPAECLFLEALPRTPTGKVDRGRLPETAPEPPDEARLDAFLTSLERLTDEEVQTRLSRVAGDAVLGH